jgi:hypothetical protein
MYKWSIGFNTHLASFYYNRGQRIMMSFNRESVIPTNIQNMNKGINCLKKNDIFALKPSNIESFNIKSLCVELKKSGIICVLDKELIKDKNKLYKYYNLLRENDVNPYMTFQMYLENEYNSLQTFVRNNKDARVKLVRGAYKNQEDPSLLLESKKSVDSEYRKGINLLNEKDVDTIYATYNISDLKYINNLEKNQKLAFLHGISTSVDIDTRHLIYQYVLYGKLIDTIPFIKRQLPSFLYNRFHSCFTPKS